MLRAHVVVTHLSRLLAGAPHTGASSARIPHEEVLVVGRRRGVAVHEPLLRALLRHAERGADLGPGPARVTRRVDEVPEQQVRLAGDLARHLGGGRDARERVLVGAAVVHGLDELGQRRGGCHRSTLS